MATFKKSGISPNYIYPIAGITLALFTLGLFAILFTHAQHIVQGLKESLPFTVELQPDAKKEDIEALKTEIEQSEYAKPGTVRYITSTEAAELLKPEFGDLKSVLDTNFLANTIEFNVSSPYLNPDALGSGEPGSDNGIIGRIQSHSCVLGVFYQKDAVVVTSTLLRKITYFVLGLGILLILVTFATIRNTLKVSLYAQRFLIRNMQLVGATKSFISAPFLKKAVINGLIGSIIACVGLVTLIFALIGAEPRIESSINWNYTGAILVSLVIIGTIVSFMVTKFSLNRYLNMSLDQLY
jgi:cell division transport system permease protein